LIARPPYIVAKSIRLNSDYRISGRRHSTGLYPTPYFHFRLPVTGRQTCTAPCNTKSPGLRPTSVTSGIWIHPAIWPQQTWADNWGLCPLGDGSLVPVLRSVAMAEAYLHLRFHLDPYSRLATTDMGRKRGPRSSFLARGTWVPSNTMSLALRPTCLPSGILVDQDMWSQHIWAENWGGCAPFGEETRVRI